MDFLNVCPSESRVHALNHPKRGKSAFFLFFYFFRPKHTMIFLLKEVYGVQVQKKRRQMMSSISLSKAVQSSYPTFSTLCLLSLLTTNEDGFTGPVLLAHRSHPVLGFGCPGVSYLLISYILLIRMNTGVRAVQLGVRVCVSLTLVISFA